jgi:hypothetical protein
MGVVLRGPIQPSYHHMRISTLSLVFALFATTANAQVTITQNEMPFAGDNLFRTQAVLNPLLNYNATGANFTWNFNNLVAQGQDSRSYQTVGSTNIVYALVYADIFLNANRANHATEGVDVPFYDILPIENPYTFYFRSANVYRKVGYGAEVAGFPIPITMDQQDVVYQLPLNFGNTSTSNSSYTIDIPTLAFYGYSQTRNNVVDGWGTINTPAGSFNALRVKTTIAGRDTIQVDQVSLGFAIERPLVTEYKWLSPGRRVPILQVNTSTVFGVELITEIFFYDVERTLNVVNPLANNFCPGQSLVVNYTKTGVFNQGGILVQPNIFRAQLSDATGSFANPVNIGSVTSNQSGSINAVIPANTPPGTGYRIRVIATNPAFNGTPNSFNITIGTTPQAVATAAGPITFCDGGSVTLNANTAPAFTYQWQLGGVDIGGATTSTLNAVASGSYRVVVSSTCGTATSAPVAVQVNALPEHALVAPTDLSTCAGEPVIFAATDLSGQGGLEYQWLRDGQAVDGENGIELSTAIGGSYALQVTNASTGCSYTTTAATLAVETVPVPLALANGPTTVCDGVSVVLEATDADGAALQWYLDGVAIAGADEASLSASESGSYTVVATSVNGCSSDVSAAVEVTVDPVPSAPALSAAGATTFCAGEQVLLTAAGDAGVTWQWSLDGSEIPGADSNELSVSASGTYTVLATNAFGCTTEAAASVAVTVNPVPPVPAVAATGPTTVCTGESVLLQATDIAGATYQWFLNGAVIAGADASVWAATEGGSYSVSLTNTFACTTASTQDLVVTIDPVPNTPGLSAAGATTFCAGGDVTLQADGDAGVVWEWTLNGQVITGADTDQLTVSASGDYGVTATNSFGCATSANATVTVQVDPIPAVPAVVAADVITFCDGGAVTLIAMADPDDVFLWTLDGTIIPGAEQNQYLASLAGDYAAIAVNAAGCSSAASAPVTVTVLPLPAAPTVNIGGPTEFCDGGSVFLNAISTPGSAFEWYLNGTAILGAGGAGYAAEETGSYSVIATNVEGCVSLLSDPVLVEVEALPSTPFITALDTTTFCAGGAVVLVAVGDAGTTNQWLNNDVAITGADAAQLVTSNSGTYTAISTSATGCSSAPSQPIEVNVLPLPTTPLLSANGPTSFCVGGEVTLNATADAGTNFQWTLNGSDLIDETESEITVSESGGYAVVSTDAFGCTSTSGIATVFVEGLPDAAVLSATSTTTLCLGSTVVLEADAAPGLNYTWSLNGAVLANATGASYEAGVAGEYTVVVATALGCAAQASNGVTVIVNALPATPAIILSEPPTFCAGASTTLIAIAAPDLDFQWTLNGEPIAGATQNQLTVSEGGLYSLGVTNASGCSANAVASVVVTVNELPETPLITQSMDTLFTSGAGPHQWYLNGVLIPGATDDFLVVETNGNYTVTTTNANGCTSTSAVTTVSNVGVGEVANTTFSVYPNPSNGNFTIRLNGIPAAGSFFTLHDATGKIVQQGALLQLMTNVELTDPRSGMYFIQLVQGGRTTTQRIVVER